jgi:hypothetical protein
MGGKADPESSAASDSSRTHHEQPVEVKNENEVREGRRERDNSRSHTRLGTAERLLESSSTLRGHH